MIETRMAYACIHIQIYTRSVYFVTCQIALSDLYIVDQKRKFESTDTNYFLQRQSVTIIHIFSLFRT